ncbi:MAG: intradiol ring-cleavage dioxygenase [Dehalococcoidia bacterium]
MNTPRFGQNARHDLGLQYDLRTLMNRRTALRLFGGTALFTLVGCSSDDDPAATPTAGATTPSTSGSGSIATQVAPIPTTASTPITACTQIPGETAGPFPGNGSNGPNVLTQSGIVRSDIRQSLGISTNTATGVPLVTTLTLVDTKNACKPLANAAVYIWQCDQKGGYSLYSPGVTNENYLRGVQVADANGVVSFTSVFPAAYPGRWPHIHFEVYNDLASATSSRNKRATSQLALPEDACTTVFATSGYEQSRATMRQLTLASDGVFRDGWDLQMAKVDGSVANGVRASLIVGL